LRITEDILEWKSSGSGSRKSRLTAWGSVALTTRHLHPQEILLNLSTCGGRSVDIVRLRTKATEFGFVMSTSDGYRLL
jgi:hypothetical protein